MQRHRLCHLFNFLLWFSRSPCGKFASRLRAITDVQYSFSVCLNCHGNGLYTVTDASRCKQIILAAKQNKRKKWTDVSVLVFNPLLMTQLSHCFQRRRKKGNISFHRSPDKSTVQPEILPVAQTGCRRCWDWWIFFRRSWTTPKRRVENSTSFLRKVLLNLTLLSQHRYLAVHVNPHPTHSGHSWHYVNAGLFFSKQMIIQITEQLCLTLLLPTQTSIERKWLFFLFCVALLDTFCLLTAATPYIIL